MIDLCCLSTHQGFVSPEAARRKVNVEKTIHSIELACELGIGCMRVNTGTWGTSRNFDDLSMKGKRTGRRRSPGACKPSGIRFRDERLESRQKNCRGHVWAAAGMAATPGLGGQLPIQGTTAGEKPMTLNIVRIRLNGRVIGTHVHVSTAGHATQIVLAQYGGAVDGLQVSRA